MKNLFYGLLLTLLFTTTPAAAYNSSDLNQLMSSGSCAYGDLSGADLSSLDLTGANQQILHKPMLSDLNSPTAIYNLPSFI